MCSENCITQVQKLGWRNSKTTKSQEFYLSTSNINGKLFIFSSFKEINLVAKIDPR